MSAELLRRAAKEMREKAEAADTGEAWETEQHYDGIFGVFFKPSLTPEQNEEGLDGDWERRAWTTAGYDQARHIASWHPAVAFAVAAWLDHEAEEIGPLRGPDGRELTYVHGDPFALTVAGAYLGVQP